MNKDKNRGISQRLYLSTIAGDAAETAKQFNMGLEVAEFCTASNMDKDFAEWDAIVKNKMKSADRFVMHAPFNELCPAAIDPLVLEIASKRYQQAYALAKSYKISRIVVHSGYVPFVYFKGYFVERSIAFWRDYLSDKPEDFHIAVENVLEDSPNELIEIVKGVDDPRFRLCFDVGHANITKNGISMEEWTKAVLPYLGHVHLHNNNGWPDAHAALGDGNIDMEALLTQIIQGQPGATLTIESIESRSSVNWLIDKGFLI
jgi:sugar phosphate isomerase/epimerase